MIPSELSPEFFAAAAGIFSGKTIRLGLIPPEDVLPPLTIKTDPLAVIAAEYNGVGHVRPSFVMPSIGEFSVVNDRWEFPPELSFTITGPVTFAQYFFLVGGIDTPRNTTRDWAFSLSHSFDPVTVPSGATQTLLTPWTIS
jgi:hypothetical protein